MRRLKIRIFDDEDEFSEKWSGRLREVIPEHDVEPLSQDDFDSTLSDLIARRSDARKNEGPLSEGDRREIHLDEIDVLVVDYDLIELEDQASVLSGEDIAYLVRCYSSCKYIIILNQYGENPFNLKLRRPLDSFADLNIGAEQLDNDGLWHEVWPENNFRPWYWPIVPNEVESFQNCVGDLEERLSEPLLNYLGFDEEARRFLSPESLDFISVNSTGDQPSSDHEDVEPTDVTFVEFVRSSGNGLRPKDKAWDEGAYRRIAASRIRRWLDGEVLASQNILVDAPHLAARLPALVPDQDDSSWKQVCTLSAPDWPKHKETLERFRYEHRDWISRDAWKWFKIRAQRREDELRPFWSGSRPPLVFCEDVSTFVPSERAHRFVADVSTPYDERFVVGPVSDSSEYDSVRDVTYQPRIRLSM